VKATPKVVAQNTDVTYKLMLKNTSNIESIEVLARGDYYHKDSLDYTIKNNRILFTYTMPHIGEFVIKVNSPIKSQKLFVCIA